jgi:Universal stress protein family
MANILVPTDFSPASLKMAEHALWNTRDSKVTLILFHAFEVSAFPFELLRTGYRDPSAELMTEPFRQACKQLKDDHSHRISKIIVRCMNGDTRAMFKNFAEANDVDMIFCPEDYVFSKVHKQSVNPLNLFKKCGLPVVKTTTRKREPVFSNKNLVAELQPVNAVAGAY